MKQLNADGTITIPSNYPRTHLGRDSRGYRICIAQIGRSCSTDTGFVTFTDGSAYVYDPPSKDEFEGLCAAIHRGRQFNFSVRRSRGGFVRGFTPPADYEIIYNYPPYAGSTPAACAVPGGNWPNLTWVTHHTEDMPSCTQLWTPGDGVSASQKLAMRNPSDFTNASADATGTCIYNGPSAPGFLALDRIAAPSIPGSSLTVFVFQDGNVLLFFHRGGGAPFSDPGSFTFADTAGADSMIEIDASYSSFPSSPGEGFDWTMMAS